MVRQLSIWLKDIFFLPSKFILSFVSTRFPELAQLLEMEGLSRDGAIAIFVSTAVWLSLAISLGTCLRILCYADAWATASIRRGYLDTLRRLRVQRIKVACIVRKQWNAMRAPRRESHSAISVGTFEISEPDRAVLEMQLRLQPGYLLEASDVAQNLKISLTAAQSILERLQHQGLIDSALSSSDGEIAYRLNPVGKAFATTK